MSFTPGAGTSYLLSSTAPVPSGTANGVLFLNGSKVVTSGSALTFDGTDMGVGGAVESGMKLKVYGAVKVQSAQPIYYMNSDNTNNVQIANVGATGASNGQMTFTLGGVGEQMRLTSTGLGIGTSSPSTKLDVSVSGGMARIGGASGNNLLQVYTGSVGAGIWAGGTTRLYTTGGFTFSTGATITTSTPTGYTDSMTLDSSGNLGLGVTPSAWNSSAKALQIPYGAFWNVSDGVYLGTNYFLNSSAQRIYSNTGKFALEYLQYAFDGSHRWYTAPSGTAGNTISFTQAMTLDASGNLGIGTTSPASAIHAQRASGAAIYLQLAQTGVGSWQIGMSASSNGLAFLQSGSEKIRIKETGQTRFVPLSSDPAGAEAGDVYYNSSTNKLRVYNGTAWVDLH